MDFNAAELFIWQTAMRAMLTNLVRVKGKSEIGKLRVSEFFN